MSESNKFFSYTIGLIFLLAGLGFILEILHIPFSSIVLLLMGIFTWCMYFKFNNRILKYITCFFIPIGVAFFIIAAFNIVGKWNFLLLYVSIASSFICLYVTSKKGVFIYVSLTILLFALHTATNSNKNMGEMIWGYDCFYIGVLSVILFAFEYKRLRFKPLLISLIAYLCGVLCFLVYFGIITPMIFKMIFSLLFLLIGAIIILYNYYKSKRLQ